MRPSPATWRRSRGAPMSDNSRNAGPAGQPRATAPSSGRPSPPRSLSGRSDELDDLQPCPIACPMRRAAARPLGVSDDEFLAFIRDNKIEFHPGPDDEGERAFEEMLAAVRRAKPGRPKQPPLQRRVGSAADLHRTIRELSRRFAVIIQAIARQSSSLISKNMVFRSDFGRGNIAWLIGREQSLWITRRHKIAKIFPRFYDPCIERFDPMNGVDLLTEGPPQKCLFPQNRRSPRGSPTSIR